MILWEPFKTPYRNSLHFLTGIPHTIPQEKFTGPYRNPPLYPTIIIIMILQESMEYYRIPSWYPTEILLKYLTGIVYWSYRNPIGSKKKNMQQKFNYI